MSAERDRLEAQQSRLRELEALRLPDEHLLAVAEALEREARSFEQYLERGERKAERSEHASQAARVLGFGFSLLFVTPMVAMIGVSLAKLLRHAPELSVLVLGAGLAAIAATLSSKVRHLLAHRASREWARVRQAQRDVAALRSLLR